MRSRFKRDGFEILEIDRKEGMRASIGYPKQFSCRLIGHRRISYFGTGGSGRSGGGPGQGGKQLPVPREGMLADMVAESDIMEEGCDIGGVLQGFDR